MSALQAVIVLAVLGFVGGIFLALVLAPPLADSRLGTIAFWASCILAGFALAALAVNVFGTLHDLHQTRGSGLDRADLLRTGLVRTMYDSGVLIALAVAVQLLGPKRPHQDESASPPG